MQAPNPTNPGPEAADTDAHRQVANGLVTMGNDLARLLHALAQAASQPVPHAAAPRPVPAPDALIRIAAAFDKTARTVRRCILLAQRLARSEPPPNPARSRAAARARILRKVEDTIDRAADTPNHAETLAAELHERLDAPDLDDDLAARPVAEIITEICRDLGLDDLPGTTPWRRRTPADLARLRARAAAPTPARPQGSTPDAPGRPPAARPHHAPPPDPAAAIVALLHPTPCQDHAAWQHAAPSPSPGGRGSG